VLLLLLSLSLFALVSYSLLLICYSAIRLLSRKCGIKLRVSVCVNELLWHALMQVLRSSEGRELRATHQENVRYLRGKLLEAGLPVIHTPSHIIPVHVCLAVINTDLLLVSLPRLMTASLVTN